MEYQNFLPNYPYITDPIFQQKILNKKEFYDLKLNKSIEKIEEGQRLYSQQIITNFMNEHTLYDELLIYHAVGTGKSGVAFSVTEELQKSDKFFRAYIFARGEDLLKSLRKQLVYFYSKRYRNMFDKNEIKFDNEERILKKITSDFYSFRTIETFAKEIEKVPDEYLKKEYSNCIFIVDEIQNLIEQSEEETKFYKQFHRLFHIVDNRKILLMSGTPMRNDVQEIAEIMNLILPINNQMPIKDEFINKFIKNQNIINQEELKNFLRGRISYLRESTTNIPYKFMGEFISKPPIEQFKLQYTVMNPFQSRIYENIYIEESTGKNMSFYGNTRQASLFTFPNEKVGNEGLNSVLNRNHNLTQDFINKINTIDKLAAYSSKYAYILRDILNNPKKKIYIYCSVVNGSGCNLFAKILELYGFEKVRGGGNQIKNKRYILLTSETQNLQKDLGFFNMKGNKYGEYCQVVIGSRKISEGFTFKDIQIIHITTLHWNYTETQQAIARGIRLGSHKNLIEDGLYPNVKIYQHASLPQNKKIMVIDEYMLNISREKDITIKKMERIAEEVAIDCPLFYERNVRNSNYGSRDCNYESCDYKCDTSSLEPSIPLDLDTYNLYYQTDENIINFLKQIFKIEFSIHIDTIQDRAQLDRFQLIRVLNLLIQNNIPIVNKYGIECYLREHNNFYYLVDNIIFKNNQSEMGIYTKQPFFSYQISLDELIHKKSIYQISKIINNISNTGDEKLILRLSTEFQELFIEHALYIKLHNGIKNKLIDSILKLYKNNIKFNIEPDIIAVSDLLGIKLRALTKKFKWIDYLQPIKLIKDTDINILENNPYGYIGIMEDEKFCIKEINKGIKKDDLRKEKSGSNCLTSAWNKDKLAALFVELDFKIEDPENIPTNARGIIMNSPKYLKYLDTSWNNFNDSQLCKILYWMNTKKDKKVLCTMLKEWFNEKGLLIQGHCGKYGKKK